MRRKVGVSKDASVAGKPASSGHEEADGASQPVVVGVGASAGGLPPLKALLAVVPPRAGLAVVVVEHLDQGGQQLRVESLSGATRMPVVEIRDGMRLEAGHVYVAPAQAMVALDADGLRLLDPEADAPRTTPIDRFFFSLAEARQEDAIGIVLSGAGTDGALGLKAIGDAGGMTMAQAPESASCDTMPRNAITTGVVDHVLAPEEMGRELMAYLGHLHDLAERKHEAKLQEDISAAIPTLAATLRKQIGHNFKDYKASTLVRRVQRRMQVLRTASIDRYIRRLACDEEECAALFRELLIGVTAFFRDPDAFEALSQKVIARLLQTHPTAEPIRIWVPGCASGEEAYTLAMLCREQMDALGASPEVQIFATDINERALDVARQGVYPAGIARDVSPERLKRFFVKRARSYHVAKDIRELCVFSSHNLISDPPFSRLDVISCRNLLIYLAPHLQEKLFPLFHYALRSGGYLFLGPSEKVTSHRELFRPVDAKQRISQRRPVPTSSSKVLSALERPEGGTRPPDLRAETEIDLNQIGQRIALDEFAPEWAIVNEDAQVMALSPDAGKYLGLAGGMFHNNVIKMARTGLRVGMRTALKEALARRCRVDHENLSVRVEGGVQRMMLTVQPMPQLGEDSGLLMVVFHEVGGVMHREAAKQTRSADDTESLIDQLERELATTRDDLEKTIQNLEAANEELKSSNEELRSMNEELQSANEELETSKEEIQAGNEALARAKNDLENLLRSTQIATLFLDDDLSIQSFTPAVTDIYHVIESDIGRPLWHLTHRALEMPPLPDPADVARRAVPIEHLIETQDGRSFARRVMPYRTREGLHEGIVVTFTDVTDLRAAQRERQVSEERLRNAMQAADVGTWRVDLAAGTEVRDASLNRILGLEECDSAEPMGSFIARVHAEDRQRVEDAWQAALRGTDYYDVEARILKPDGEVRWIRDRGRVVRGADRQPSFATGAVADITERKAAEEVRTRLAAIIESSDDAIIGKTLDGIITSWNGGAQRLYGYTAEDMVGTPIERLVPPNRHNDVADIMKRLRRGESVEHYETVRRCKDGTLRDVSLTISPIRTPDGIIVGASTIARDITERKRREAALRERDVRIQSLLDATAEGIYGLDLDGRCTFANAACARTLGYDSPQELVGREMHSLVHHHRADGAPYPLRECPIHQSSRSGERVHVDDDVLWRKDGTSFPAEYWSNPLCRDDEVVGSVVTFLDIQDRKRAEQALRDSEARFKAMADASPAMLWIADPQNQCTFISRAWQEYTGQHLDEGLGIGRADAIHPDDRERARETYLRAAARLEPFRLDYRLRHVSGAYRWALDAGKPWMAHTGELLGYIGSVIDVHERKLAEEALKEADQRKDEFLAMLGHELRNPLGAIRSATELVRLEEADERSLQRAYGVLDRQAAHMARLLDDLLDVSRISRGKIRLNTEILDMRSVIDTALQDRSEELDKRGLELDARLPDEPVWVRGDLTRLTQVFDNLIANAIKFTDPPGSVQVTLERDAGEALARVRDTGTGIAPDTLAHIFEAFQQAAQDMARASGGLGLGLALVKGLVELHGGRVGAHSQGLGSGAEFQVRLPLSAAPQALPKHETPAKTGARRVLIVEDNADVAQALGDLLEAQGHSIIIADSAPAALHLLRERGADVALCDIGLPGMSGYELARAVRDDAKLRDIPLIAMTGYGQEDDRRTAREAGFDAHLTKPVDMQDLQKALAQLGLAI